MLSFTFTSEDLERVNKDKKPNDKVFIQLENVRVAKGLMEKDEVTINWQQVEKDFLRDATRGTPTILKKGEDLKVILGTTNLDTQEKKELEVQNNMKVLEKEGLSDQQIKDFKFMTNQANIGSVAGDVLMYTATKDPEISLRFQNVGGAVVQLETSKTPPDNQERLTYRTATRVTFDKNRTECNYSPYGMSSSYEIPSQDSMIIVLQVDLGPLGAKEYKPQLTCSIHAEGADAKNILDQIKQDIPINGTQKAKNSESIKAEYEEIAVKTLKLTGQEEVFFRNVKEHIGKILSAQEIEGAKLAAIKEFKSTPKLFAEVLVDKIDEALKQDTPEARKDAIQALSNNASIIIDHPRGYMNILINNIARDRATKAGQELPKEKFIQRVKDKLNLIFVKFQSKTASQNIKIIREVNKAKSQGQSR
jgi:hypothetical protein